MTGPAPSRPSTALLVAVMAGGHVGMTIILPSMPAIRGAFAIDTVTVQLALTLYFLSYAAAQLAAGPLSDRFGRRPFILGGLALFALASVLCALAPTIEALLAGRVLQGIGACSGMVVVRAMVRDVYSTEETARMLAIFSMTLGLVPALAPMAGGLIETHVGWRGVFAASALYAAAILVPAGLTLRETRPPRDRGGRAWIAMASGFAALARSRLFAAYVAVVALTSAAFFAYLAASPLVFIERLGLTPAAFGMVALVYPLGYTAGGYVSVRLSRRVGIDRMIVSGGAAVVLSCLAMVALALGGAVTVAAAAAPLFFVGIGQGMVVPNALAGTVSVRPDHAGTAAALGGALQIASGAAISPLMGAFAYHSQLPLAAVLLALSAAALVIGWRLPSR